MLTRDTSRFEIVHINDTRPFHEDHGSALTGESTLGMTFTANQDLCRGAPGSVVAYELLMRWWDNTVAETFEFEAPRVLLIGPGEGYIAFDFMAEYCVVWNRLLKHFQQELGEEPPTTAPPTFTVLDYSEGLLNSPTLLAAVDHVKKAYGAEVHRVQGDANDLSLTFPANNQFETIVANEMIGDLLTVDVRTLDAPQQVVQSKIELTRMVERLAKDYSLSLTEDDRLNIGAIRLLEEADRLLTSGGVAYVSEHSTSKPIPTQDAALGGFSFTPRDNNRPTEIRLDGHSEFTTAFDDLEQVSGKLAKSTERGSLVDLFQIQDTEALLPSALWRVVERFYSIEEFAAKGTEALIEIAQESENPLLRNLATPQTFHYGMFYIAYHPVILTSHLNIPREAYERFLVSARDLNDQFEYLVMAKS